MPESKLSANMRSLRDTYGYSQQNISDLIHVARQTYSVYETGKRVPELQVLCQLADLYHITLDQLIYQDLTDGVLADAPEPHRALCPNDSQIRLTGAEAKMLMDYKEFPADAQKEVREFVRFKKHYLAKESKDKV